MDANRWERIQSLFHEAAELLREEQRPFLESACGADADLLATVLAMLEEDAGGPSLLDRGVGRVAREVLGAAALPLIDVEQFRSYRFLELLGEGGMGVVYLAERPDLGSRVAIKVLRDAWLSPARRNRFAAEQRTLAQLNHPGIARLYDADTLADGTPWFVMEYVEGVPLTEYCVAHRCSVEQRLALFRAVCEAVQYAHEHGVIHRDLKPSNILVKPDGTVRLLDFGIARHLDSAESVDAGARTTTLLMTPAYASPEQIRGERAGVQSDVYSLGVILYELLCGQLPFAFSRTTALAVVMATTQDPVRPSAAARVAARRVSDSAPERSRPEAARRHQQAPAQTPAGSHLTVGRSSWADLDVLCLTAMRRDAQRRYPSVDALIGDIDRYLGSQPLAARPDTVGYRLGKFTRRHWRELSAAVVVFAVAGSLAVLLGLQVSSGLDRGLAASTTLRTVAVLPFRNLGSDPDLEFLRLALPDEIATNLSYTRSLAVRPFATTSRYSDPDLDLRKVGQELRVSSVVTGEFSERDDDLEVTLEAIDVADNRLLWRNTFRVAAGNMIGGRERVTAEIGSGLTAALGVPASAPRTASAPKSEEAYDLYLRSAGARYDPGAPNQEAIRILERALAIDSTYAPAWLALARRLYVRAQYETGDSATMAYSIAASQRAVALDPDFILARARLIGLRIERGELAAAYREASDLVRRRPDSPDAHFTLSYLLRFAGLLEEAGRECATALSLDPHNFGWRSCAVASLGRDDYQGAMAYIQLDAGSEFSKALTIHTLVRQGEEQQALAVGRPNMPQWKSYDLLLACLERRPRSAIADLAATVQPVDDPETNYFAAAHLAFCGETRAALAMLELAIAGHYCSYPILESDPFFRRLRAEPGFARVLQAGQACQRSFLAEVGRDR